MALPLSVDAVDEKVARGVAFEAREASENAAAGNSTYIQTYVAEYIDDLANTLRTLRACQGNSAAAAQRLIHTVRWRQANKLDQRFADGIVFIKADELPAMTRQLGDYVTKLNKNSDSSNRNSSSSYSNGTQAQNSGQGNVCQKLSLQALESKLLDDYVKQTSGVYSDQVSTYAGDLQSLYSDARDYVARSDGAAEGRDSLVSAKTSNRSGDGSVYSFGKYLDQMDFGNRRSGSLAMTMLNRPLDSGADKGIRAVDTAAGRATLDRAAHIDAGRGYTRYSASRSDSTIDDSDRDGSESRRSFGSITPIQLASLQRTVQGVQQMLGTINDSIVSADSRATLATMRTKLAQQTDVLMSTVAALSFGVSMAESTQSNMISASKNAFYITNKAHGHSLPTAGGGAFKGFIRQLLALPLSILFGKRGSAVKIIKSLTNKVIRTVLRRMRTLPTMRTLLMLAFRHLRLFAMVFWTSALLIWQANSAVVWLNLTSHK
ncbi:hypothetical protein GGI12_000290 [Dipsacomyces acuminosporus]|nr:hypothetical protein GGI12_000290 [Dipsacomyces acuminosporus]